MPIVIDGPRPEGWTLFAARRASGDVELHLNITTDGITDGTVIRLTREEARTFARGVLAEAGDGTERTFGWDKGNG